MSDEINLVYPLKKGKRKGLKKKIFIAIAIILAIFVILGVTTMDNAKAAYNLAMEGKDHLVKVQESVSSQDLKEAATEIEAAKNKFDEAQKEFNWVRWAVVVPYVGSQISASGTLIDSAVTLTDSLAETVTAGLEILSPLQSEEVTSFSQLSPEEKGDALEKLGKAIPLFEQAQEDVKEVKADLEDMGTFAVRPEIISAKDMVLEKLPMVEKFTEELLLAAKILPRIGGHPDEQQYLFVSQNNHELRASGGFIGNVGIMKVYEGDVVDFTTSGVYNLDAEAPVKIEPPEYLKKYLKSTTWYLRDANTCVGCIDFAVAAKNILEFYKIETGSENFDGVISITPTFLEDLLAITGPVEVPGYPYTFTEENVTETLQEHVEVNFAQMGIPLEDRQALVSDLSNVLLQKTFTLPKEKWLDLVTELQKAFNEKHAMIYMKDDATQAVLREEGWTSQLDNDWEQDYIALADNNMAALKTDRVMDRSLNYEIDISNINEPTAKLQITYINNGRFTHFTTRYRTWSQLYVPAQAELLRYEGVEVTDKEGPAGEIVEEIDPHSGRKVWSYFKSVEPGTQETVTIEYKLPPTVMSGDEYSLLVQKQPGTIDPKLNVTVIGADKPQMVSPMDVSTIDDKNVSFDSNLLIDRQFNINY